MGHNAVLGTVLVYLNSGSSSWTHLMVKDEVAHLMIH